MITLGNDGEGFLRASKGHNLSYNTYPQVIPTELLQLLAVKKKTLQGNSWTSPGYRFLKCSGPNMDMIQIVSDRNLSKWL